jgi:AraC-like DNA-binding protein
MRTRTLSELSFTNDIRVLSLFAMKQHWREGHTFAMRTPRRQSAFLWFCGASGCFRTEAGEVITAAKGALVYIPEGSVYTLTFSECTGEVSTILIEFCPETAGEPFVLSPVVRVLEVGPIDSATATLITRMARAFSMPERPYLSLLSDFFSLLSLLASASEQRRISKRGLTTIEAGIRYLQTDEKQALSLDEVAAMCFVTPAYFRRLFQKYAGVSPSEYRTARRIERAKELLRNSAMSVSAISETLGFESPSYFCRVFKQRTGVSPLTYQKEKCIEK